MDNFKYIYNYSRKYCIDKIKAIRHKYKEIDDNLNNNSNYKIPNHLKEEILNDSIRVEILRNMLISLEKYDIENEELCKESKEFIKKIYKKSTMDYKKYRCELKSKIDILCKQEIRKLDECIDNINIEVVKFDDLQLFYRHVLINDEYLKKKNDVLSRIKELKNCKTIKIEIFIKDYKDRIYREISNKYKNEYIYELNISDYSYVLDVKGLNFVDTYGFNTYWFDGKLHWIIEKNHEGWYNIYF